MLSALLDNVTTVVLLTPVILSIARTLRVSPFPYLISEILASNIGGTATLIGDPPNILIGSRRASSFGDFLLNLAPVVVVILVAFVGIMRLAFRYTHGGRRGPPRRLALVDPAAAIRDRPPDDPDPGRAGLTIVGFLSTPRWGSRRPRSRCWAPRSLMLVGRLDPHERPATRSSGRRSSSSSACSCWSRRSSMSGSWAGSRTPWPRRRAATSAVATMAILWFSAVASAIVDNIPYTATAIPIVEQLVAGRAATPSRCGGRWRWAPASAATSRSSARRPTSSSPTWPARDGHPITFVEFLRYGRAVVAASMVISTVYLWVRYLA